MLRILSRIAALRYPIGAAPRTAVLGSWFRESRDVRVFADGWSEAVAAYAPAALAGCLEQVLAAKELELSRAVIVLHRPGEPLLTADDRERLWHTFHVPVFEQIVGSHGQLVAFECEAHDGLHVATSAAVRDGLSIDESACACGLKSPRMTRPETTERLRSAAVYAR